MTETERRETTLYNTNVTNSVEDDTWRDEGMQLINSLNRAVFLR